jgi:hypothetical protein
VRYVGSRKNKFDLRCASAISNLAVIQRRPKTAAADTNMASAT